MASSDSDSGGGKRRSQEVEERLSSNGYSVWSFPKCTNAVITEFPYRSMLSVLVAPFCVYPALGRYFKVSIHRVYLRATIICGYKF